MNLAATRARDFIRMNLSDFYGFTVDKNSQDFIDEVYTNLAIMSVLSEEKTTLVAYCNISGV